VARFLITGISMMVTNHCEVAQDIKLRNRQR